MMMERVKTAPAPEETKAPTTTSTSAAPARPAPTTSHERMIDLERRLNNLDPVGAAGGAAVSAQPAVAPAAPATKPVAEAAKQPAASTGKHNPLLARIIAAQERARIAEQKEKEAKAAAAAAEEERRKSQEEAEIATAKLKEFERQQQQEEQKQSTQDKRDAILRVLEGKLSPTKLPLPIAAVPIMKSMDAPPPPPFDAMGLVAPRPQQQTDTFFTPPSFNVVEEMTIQSSNSAPVPSAPPESPAHDHLEGVLPMPAPLQVGQVNMPPPPSFAEFEHQLQQQNQSPSTNSELIEDTSFDFDVDGIPLSPEERQQMIAEQRQLYENIMKEKAANDEAIAKASADAFDSRSAAAAARANGRNERMDSTGRDLDPTTATGRAKTEGERETTDEPRRFVKIGNNQTVALHGQERTKKAIKDGTAILVQCINCQNWMQVTATATLMFCPVCQVVCPVIQQNEVLTKEQAIQLTMDRKLAEKLQAEAYASNEDAGKKTAQESGYFARFFGGGETSTTATAAASPTAAAATTGQSWWDKLSSIVSYGVAEEHHERGELGVTRPPGASHNTNSISTYPGQRRPATLTPSTVAGDHSSTSNTNEETQGLLHPVVVDGNEANLPAGRVAEQRPLFSCVYDSVSSAASAVFSTGGADEDVNVYGVDSRSLLAVTDRGVGEGIGDYSRLPDEEQL